MTKEEREQAFLEEVAIATQKYGVAFAGCGCHGSPYLLGVVRGREGAYIPQDEDGEHLEWSTVESLQIEIDRFGKAKMGHRVARCDEMLRKLRHILALREVKKPDWGFEQPAETNENWSD